MCIQLRNFMGAPMLPTIYIPDSLGQSQIFHSCSGYRKALLVYCSIVGPR